MVYADGSLAVFIKRPISLILLILSAVFLIWPLVQRTREFFKQRKAA